MSDKIQAILELKAKYARFADAVFRTSGSVAAATALADLFTDDGSLNLGPFGTYSGRANLLTAFQTTLPAGTAWSTHYIVSPIINGSDDDDRVTADWYFLIYLVPRSPAHAPVAVINGGYQDTYVKIHGVWKIKDSVSLFFTPPV